jgi:hypothetical protein
MAGEMLALVGIGTIISTIFSLAFAISAFLRHREKRTLLTKVIFYAFFSYALSMAVTVVLFVMGLLDIDLGVFGLAGYLPFFLLVIGSYYMFLFSQIVFLGEHKHTTIEKLAVIMTIGCIIFGVLRYYVPDPAITAVRILWILVFAGVIAIPIFFGALYARRRIPTDDPHRSNLLYIAALAIVFVLTNVFFLLDTILTTFLLWESPTIAFLAAQICIILITYCAQRGFFSTSKPS